MSILWGRWIRSEVGQLQKDKKHFEDGPLHQPIALPFAPPDKDTEILENLVRQELLYDDNSHRWVVSKGTSTSSRNSRQSLTLLYFGIDIQRWLIAIADVLIHSHGCRSQWPYSVKALRTVPGQIVRHSPSYLGKKRNLELYSVLNAISMCPPSSKTIEVPTAHDVEKVKKHEYRGMVSNILTVISKSILSSHNSWSPPPIQNLWFVFNMAVFMNQYFMHRCQDARVVPVYWKNVGHSHILKALKVEMHCGDIRKYHGKTAKQQRTGELQGSKNRALHSMPEDIVNDSRTDSQQVGTSFSAKRLRKSKQ